MLVTGQKVFEGFGQGELQIHLATERQHHHEKGEPTLGGSDRNRSRATPVHLGAFSGGEVQGQESGLAPRTHLADERLDDGVSALIAVLSDLLQNLLSRVIVPF